MKADRVITIGTARGRSLRAAAPAFQSLLLVSRSYADYLRSLQAPDSRDLAAHREFFRGFLASIDPARFVVVVIPVLHDLENYKFGAAHDYVKGLAAEREVAVIDLLEAFKGMRAEDLIVNAYDYHFNEKAHAIVADYLLVALERIGFL